jgi:hypothetical protein
MRYIFENFLVPQGQKEWLMDQTNYLWQAAYMAAVYETDYSLMDGRILEARAAIEQRLLSPVEDEEYRAIQNAEEALEVLRADMDVYFMRAAYATSTTQTGNLLRQRGLNGTEIA